MTQTTTTSYSASHRASYMRYQNKNQSRMRAYYVANKEEIKRKRRERYAARQRTTAPSSE